MLLHTSSPLPPAPHAPEPTNQPALLGQSFAVRRLRTQVERIAPYLRTALVTGEPGTGKTQIARALHDAGPQADGPFVVCSAVVFAEALFGERSPEDATSLVESARGGTLYLRGVDELSYPLQGSLQRFLAERESMRMNPLSAGRPAHLQREAAAEVRIIVSSQRDLRTLSSVGQFRAELYSKLSVLEVRVPALRERLDDIESIAKALLERAARRVGAERKVLATAAVESLKAQDWPGNLRELEHALIEGAATAQGQVLQEAHLLHSAAFPAAPAEAAPVPKSGQDDRLDSVVQRHVLQVLTRCRGNKLRASEVLGISRSTLYRMLDSGSFATQTEQRGK